MRQVLAIAFSCFLFNACSGGDRPADEKMSANVSRTLSTASEQRKDCDLDRYHAIRRTHFIETALVLMGKPIYPENALKNRVCGLVNVDIIIGRDGRVIEACSINGPESLRDAAEKAALATSFKKNFGHPGPGRQEYQREVLAFLFVIDQSEPVDELHYIVVRPPGGDRPTNRPNPPLQPTAEKRGG